MYIAKKGNLTHLYNSFQEAPDNHHTKTNIKSFGYLKLCLFPNFKL